MITATEVRTGVKTSNISDETGHFNIPFLAPGEYEVAAELAGFRSFVRRGIRLATGDHPILDFKLEVGQFTHEISVTEAAPLVDVANIPSNLSFNNRQVDKPAFDPTYFVTASQYQFHVRTIPTTFSQYRQDGINNFDASIIKNFRITENKSVQFRAEAFNVLNHPTFGAPNMVATNGAFGTINTIANRPRQVQLGARFIF